ncbi:MAG: SET domain-containing protein-lysine N-methyltransferase [Pyrinomonadaceae bacterium]
MSAGVQTAITKVRVRRVNGAYALITDRAITADEVVFALEGEITEHPSKYSVQIGKHKHLEPLSHDPSDVKSLIHFFNHGCDPSTRINFEDLTVRALRDLEPGEEVTFNYNATEYEMANPFNCHCNSKNCLGYISGFKHLTMNRQMELISQLAPYLSVTT